MNYKLWLDSYNNVVAFYCKEKRNFYSYCKECYPLKFKSNNNLKDEFSIKEIDSLTCSFKNEEEFIKKLRNSGDRYISDSNEKHLLLTHVYHGYLKQDEIVYQDQLLKQYAINSRGKKELKMTSELNQFIEYIKSLALNDITSDYILDPTNIDNLSFEEKRELKDTLPQDIYKRNNNYYNSEQQVVRFGLSNLLKQYKIIKESYYTMEDTIELDEELAHINKQISSYFIENYQNLRKVIIWENKYKNILINKIDKETSEAKRIELLSQLEQIQIEQDYRNGINDRRNSIELISQEDAEIFIEQRENQKYKITEITNERMAELYNQGGLTAVMENMDIDEIYGNMEDAHAIGLFPKQLSKTKRK